MKFKQLQSDMVAAMKARDKSRKDSISSLISAVKKVAIDEGCREDITDDIVDKVVLKELKSVQEMIDTCPDSRQDLKDEYTARLQVFEEYAPKLLSEDEIKNIINEKFADVIASKNKGAIMKAVMPEFKGKADGKLINQIVSQLCK